MKPICKAFYTILITMLGIFMLATVRTITTPWHQESAWEPIAIYAIPTIGIYCCIGLIVWILKN